MSIVHQPVHDGIGERGFAEPFMPMIHGDLTGNDRGFSSVSVFHDFQKITPLFIRERREPPVIE